jgi:predicted transcriptional regulator
MSEVLKNENIFFSEISELLQQSRNVAYKTVNTIMVRTYWQTGKRIVEQEQHGQARANYGDYLITNLSRYLSDKMGKGFSEANLKNIRQFYMVFPDLDQFDTQCVANLTWTLIHTGGIHFKLLRLLLKPVFWIASSFLLAMTIRFNVIASLRSNPVQGMFHLHDSMKYVA